MPYIQLTKVEEDSLGGLTVSLETKQSYGVYLPSKVVCAAKDLSAITEAVADSVERNASDDLGMLPAMESLHKLRQIVYRNLRWDAEPGINELFDALRASLRNIEPRVNRPLLLGALENYVQQQSVSESLSQPTLELDSSPSSTSQAAPE